MRLGAGLRLDAHVCTAEKEKGCEDSHLCPPASRMLEPKQANHTTSRAYPDTRAATASARVQSAGGTPPDRFWVLLLGHQVKVVGTDDAPNGRPNGRERAVAKLRPRRGHQSVRPGR